MSDRASAYVREIQGALGLLQAEEVEAGLTLLAEALRHDRGVYICGNGGSASTASHLAVDLGKNLRTSSGERMRVVSLTDNVPWLTAAANDEGYDNCFAAQLRNYVRPDDVVVGISASGNSQNVVRAFQLAQDRSARRLALVGFDGGRMADLATAKVHIRSFDYGVVESLHLVVAHAWVRLLAEPLGPTERRTSDVLTRGWLDHAPSRPVRIAPGGCTAIPAARREH